MGRLDGKVTIVTGGARGQGRAHAIAQATEGASVVIMDAPGTVNSVNYGLGTEDDMAETVRMVEDLDQRCVAVKADARNLDDMQRVADTAISEFGQIDSLIINHGIVSINDWTCEEEAFDEMIAVNLKGVWNSARAVLPHMIDAGRGGAVVITASIAGVRPLWKLFAYNVAKAGALGIMRSLAIDMAPHSIRCNAIMPGMVETPIVVGNDEIMNLFAGTESGAKREDIELPAKMLHLLPVSLMPPSAQAAAGVYLTSDEGKYVTGVALPVDSGSIMQPPGMPWAAWDQG